jgi:putative oxidoreductase
MREQSWNSSLIQRGIGAASKAVENLQFAAPLLTRLVIGVAFFYTGRGKLANLDRTTSFFSDLGIPFPGANALFISSLEMIGGLCLMLGLGTRIFAALLSSTMVVALMTADKESFMAKFPAELTDVAPVVLLLFLIWLILYGAGSFSLDHLASRVIHRRKNARVPFSARQTLSRPVA